jgi:hypothetical protein
MKGKAATFLILTLFLFYASQLTVKLPKVFSYTGGEIDVFTQKKPYGGRGFNVSSDAFSIGENVTLYALVQYNNWPVPSLLVAFHINGPLNSIYNVTFSRVAETNDTGIATLTFTLPRDEEVASGSWNVLCNAKIGDEMVSDYLTFQAGWIIEIVELDTLDESLSEPRTVFTPDSFIGVRLTLRNIAMVEKNVVLHVSLFDSEDYVLDSHEIYNFTVPPNNTLVVAEFMLYIPLDVLVGNVTVWANAYDAPIKEGGLPYCPEVSKKIFIVVHDIAIINVIPSKSLIYKGEILEIQVTVKNFGGQKESFNVTLYCNSDIIGVFSVNGLGPGEALDLTFVWDTAGVAVGNYTLKAVASIVEGEINIENNKFTDGMVEIVAVPIGFVHDIAVVEVEVSPQIVKKGDIVNIVVTVRNEGNFSESFDLTVFYDGKAIRVSYVSLLEAGQKRLFSFSWNTSDVDIGVYTIKAEVSHVAGEEDLADNVFVNGKVEVIAVEEYRPPWPLWLLLFVIGLLALLGLTVLGIILYRRRRLKKFRRAFFAGWNAWFYRYDLLKN